jgi:hypothetical protein
MYIMALFGTTMTDHPDLVALCSGFDLPVNGNVSLVQVWMMCFTFMTAS